MYVPSAFQDSELNELRATIEALKRQSGLSVQEQPLNNGSSAGRRHTTPGMLGKDLNAHHVHGGRVFHTLPMPTGKFCYAPSPLLSCHFIYFYLSSVTPFFSICHTFFSPFVTPFYFISHTIFFLSSATLQFSLPCTSCHLTGFLFLRKNS